VGNEITTGATAERHRRPTPQTHTHTHTEKAAEASQTEADLSVGVGSGGQQRGERLPLAVQCRDVHCSLPFGVLRQ